MDMKHKTLSIGKKGLPDDIALAMNAIRDGQDIFRSPFFSSEFTRVVAAARDDVSLFVGETASSLEYYCPLHVTRSGTARGIGCSFSDRNGIVTAPQADFDLVDLCQVQNIQQFISNGYISEILPNAHHFKTMYNNETHLDGNYAHFYETQRKRHPSHFKRLRRLRRKLDKDFSDVEFRFDDKRDATFEALMTMKREQYLRSGKHDVLRPDWVQRMFSELRNLSNDRLRLRLSSLFVDGKLVAAELNMQSEETLHGWIVAFDTEYGKYSPGNLLTQFILENMTSFDLDYYDSGIDGDHYKKYITNVRTPLAVGTFYANHKGVNPKRILGSAWKLTENTMPRPMAHILQRSRRRSEQILATEIDNISRLRGYFHALNVEI